MKGSQPHVEPHGTLACIKLSGLPGAEGPRVQPYCPFERLVRPVHQYHRFKSPDTGPIGCSGGQMLRPEPSGSRLRGMPTEGSLQPHRIVGGLILCGELGLAKKVSA